jgi:transcriptional regulator with XRE-family HTH domain
MRRVRTPKLLIHNFKQHRRNVFPTCGYTSRKNRTKQEFLDAPLYQILAKRLGVAQLRVSDVMRGRIDRVSVDMLIDLLAELGVEVHVRMRKMQQSSSQQLLSASRKLSPPTRAKTPRHLQGY